jgi:hypothetical protein
MRSKRRVTRKSKSTRRTRVKRTSKKFRSKSKRRTNKTKRRTRKNMTRRRTRRTRMKGGVDDPDLEVEGGGGGSASPRLSPRSSPRSSPTTTHSEKHIAALKAKLEKCETEKFELNTKIAQSVFEFATLNRELNVAKNLRRRRDSVFEDMHVLHDDLGALEPAAQFKEGQKKGGFLSKLKKN